MYCVEDVDTFFVGITELSDGYLRDGISDLRIAGTAIVAAANARRVSDGERASDPLAYTRN